MDANTVASGKFRPHPDVVWREVDGEVVLLHVLTGEYFGLDPVGSRVWQLLVHDGDHGRGLTELIASVVAEFDVDEATALSDVGALVQQLATQQLLVAVS